jgi:hypothetical protein
MKFCCMSLVMWRVHKLGGRWEMGDEIFTRSPTARSPIERNVVVLKIGKPIDTRSIVGIWI